MTQSADPDTLRLFLRARAEVDRCLSESLAGAQRIAYVNFPNHGNAGDPALWLGGWQRLAALGLRVVYACEPRTYHRELLAAAEPDAIVINGGGNFGDRYPRQQRGRERVLAHFPRLRTVQLPQSVQFDDPEALAKMQRLVSKHHDLTLLLRDEASLERARRWFDAPSRRCPDLALTLEPRPRSAPARTDVLWLARNDKESRGQPPAPELLTDAGRTVEVTDWLGSLAEEPAWRPSARLALTLNRRLTPRVAGDVAQARRYGRLLAATYVPLAEARASRGMRILARGRVVITDRLHGHVLSMLQGIEHVVLDNADGKVRALYEADTHASPLAHLAEDPVRAATIAAEMLAQR